ncbi:MAG: tail fiber domain-containing protein [Acidobacteria bacterium]|jgi:hypothetical protein|nr:tail fiber domain-containing protein [Acidobacteriota bacterium]
MPRFKTLFSLTISVIVVYVIGIVPLFSTEVQPVAGVTVSSSGIYFSPKVSYGRIYLTVSVPDGSLFQKNFDSGSTPYLGLSELSKNRLIDGHYTYELRISPWEDTRVREESADTKIKAEIKSQVPLTQSGHFLVRDGAIITPSNRPEPNAHGISTPMDQTFNEDLYVVGSLCVGTDCASPETWGYDVIRLKENNLSIHFDDTSASPFFPANDWRIVANDTIEGGANYFAVGDATSGKVPFKIEAGSPENSLYIEDCGRIGIKTSTPGTELHIVAGDSPAARLEQDTTSGWTAQVWDIVGNEANFFVRDTNSSKIPFRIQPGAPSSSLCIKSDGKIGIGTWTPSAQFHIEKTGENAAVIFNRTDGAMGKFTARPAEIYLGSGSNHSVRLVANNVVVMSVTPTSKVGICNTSPTHMLDVGGSGAYCDGGTWVDGSSRQFKNNIKNLTSAEAKETLENLNPVKFNYKEDETDQHLGFIAEDVPQLVATKDRRGMSPMDIVAVLTKVVQEQQKTIAQLQEKVTQLEKKNK